MFHCQSDKVIQDQNNTDKAKGNAESDPIEILVNKAFYSWP
jgi:hypothetical protein